MCFNICILFIVYYLFLLLCDPIFLIIGIKAEVYLDGKLVGKKGSWFKWEQWQKNESLGSRNFNGQNY